MLVVQPNGISSYGSGGEAASVKPAASASASPQKDVSGASPAAQRPNSAEAQDPTFDREKALLQKAAEETQKYLQDAKKTRLSIVYDEDADSFIYQSLDRSTGEVVDQYPAEDVIKRISAFRDGTGLAVDATL